MAKATKNERFEWLPVDGAHMTRDEAAIVGAIQERMRARGVRVTREAFFAECKRDKLGRTLFEWDRAALCRSAWIERAGYLLRSVTCRIVREVGTERTVVAEVRRAFVQVVESVGESKAEVRHFVGLDECMGNPEWRKQVIARALAEATNWANRYEALKECARIVSAIRETKEAMDE